MGGPMAVAAARCGHSLCVFDTNAEAVAALAARGAKVAASPVEVGNAATIVLMSLPTPNIVQVVAARRSGSIGRRIEGEDRRRLSTTGPGDGIDRRPGAERDAASRWSMPGQRRHGGARNGTLAVMVSCPKATLCGSSRSSRSSASCSTPATSRAWRRPPSSPTTCSPRPRSSSPPRRWRWASRPASTPRCMIDIINAGSGRNSASQDKFPRAVLPGTFDFGFATGLSYKDVRLCVDEAEAMGVPMVVAPPCGRCSPSPTPSTGRQSDFTSIAKVVEEWAAWRCAASARAARGAARACRT